MRLPDAWGPGAAPAAAPGTRVLWRAVDVAAPPEAVWPWVCQLRVAPYSYDLVDNLGRRSPRRLTVEGVEVGQRFAGVFTVTAVDPGRSVTARTRAVPLLGAWTCTYEVQPVAGGSRLSVVFVLPARRLVHRAVAGPMAWGDLVMARKQLRTLAGLAAA